MPFGEQIRTKRCFQDRYLVSRLQPGMQKPLIDSADEHSPSLADSGTEFHFVLTWTMRVLANEM